MKKSKIHYILFSLLILAGCFLTSFSSAQTTNNKGPINPYEIKGFIANQKASKSEIDEKRKHYQDIYDENIEQYEEAKDRLEYALKIAHAGGNVKKYVEEGVSAVANTVDDGVYLNIKYLDYQLFTMVYNDVEFDGIQYEKAFSHNYAPDFATTSGISSS